MTALVVGASETVTVDVGGRGRPITGRIVVSGAESPINWSQNYNTMELKLPALSSPDPRDFAAYQSWATAFYASKAVKQPNDLRSDRTFRVTYCWSPRCLCLHEVMPWSLFTLVGRNPS